MPCSGPACDLVACVTYRDNRHCIATSVCYRDETETIIRSRRDPRQTLIRNSEHRKKRFGVDNSEVTIYNGCYIMGKESGANEVIRRTYPLRVVRAAMCLYAMGREKKLRDNDIEEMLGIETTGIVKVWRDRGRGGNWEAQRAWVESEVEEEEVRRFETADEMVLLRDSIEVAELLLKKCNDALKGTKDVEFVAGVALTTRNIIEGMQRAHVIINKDAGRLRELEESTTNERQVEEERIQRILRRVQRAVKLEPEQLESLRKEFPGILLVISEIMPRDTVGAEV